MTKPAPHFTTTDQRRYQVADPNGATIINVLATGPRASGPGYVEIEPYTKSWAPDVARHLAYALAAAAAFAAGEGTTDTPPPPAPPIPGPLGAVA